MVIEFDFFELAMANFQFTSVKFLACTTIVTVGTVITYC